MKYLTIALFLISLAGCSDNNTESGIRLKSDTLKKLKIRDLLNMSSGLRCSWYSEFCRINLYIYTFTFNDRNVDLQIQDRTNYRNALLKGSIVE